MPMQLLLDPRIAGLANELAAKAVGPLTLIAGLAALTGVVYNALQLPDSFRPFAALSHGCFAALGLYWCVRTPQAAQMCMLFSAVYIAVMNGTFVIFEERFPSVLVQAAIWMGATFFLVDRRLLFVLAVVTIGWSCAALLHYPAHPMAKEITNTLAMLFLAGIGVHFGRVASLRQTLLLNDRLLESERERQLVSQRLAEVEKRESLDNMARGVAHDFNNLLVGIVGGLDLIETNREMPKAIESSLGTIRRAAESAQALCRQMLELSGGRPLSKRVVDLGAIVEDCVSIAEVAHSAPIEVQREGAECFVEGDPTQLERLCTNLLKNAQEALLDHESPRITVGVRKLATEQTPGRVLLWVEDNGPGVPENIRSRVFDPFFTTKFSGRGLGLASVSTTVRAHGGEIELAQSEQGALFKITLPASSAPVPEAVSVVEESVDTGALDVAILLVEDEAMVREVTEQLLQAAGCHVTSAVSGEEAIRQLQQTPDRFDFALIDATMPGMDGRDTAEALKRISPDLPLILCSGHAAEDVYAAASEVFDAFLAKPYNRSDLHAAVRGILNKR